MPHYDFFNREKVERKEIMKYLKPYFFNKESMPTIYSSMFLLLASKGLTVASPYILKTIVDSMNTLSTVDFNTAATGILLFGGARLASVLISEYRNI